MGKHYRLVILLVLMVALSACSGDAGKLTRVDVQKLNENGAYEDSGIVFGQDELDQVKKAFSEVSWQPKTKVEMSRKADYIVTLFIKDKKDMPEVLYEYEVWFNNGGNLELVSSSDSEGYGTLEKEQSEILKKVLTQK